MGRNLRTMAVGGTEAKRCLYHRPQADRDQLFFPSKDKVRYCFMTAGFKSQIQIYDFYRFRQISTP